MWICTPSLQGINTPAGALVGTVSSLQDEPLALTLVPGCRLTEDGTFESFQGTDVDHVTRRFIWNQAIEAAALCCSSSANEYVRPAAIAGMIRSLKDDD